MLTLLKGFLGTVILFFVFICLVLAILFHNTIRNLKIFRSANEKAAEKAARKAAAEEEYFRRTSTKHYRADADEPKFDENYFKSTEKKTEQQSRQQRPTANGQRSTMDGGVTIIDQRESRKADHKIFEKDEGEYVDFEEVKQ